MGPAESEADTVVVEVVYCPAPHVIDLTPLRMAVGSTVADAVQACGVLGRHGLQLDGLIVGLWGRACELTQTLRERDRVEIYRPLLVDPKEARRQRYKGKSKRTAVPTG